MNRYQREVNSNAVSRICSYIYNKINEIWIVYNYVNNFIWIHSKWKHFTLFVEYFNQNYLLI